MRERNATWYVRTIRWMLASVLIWAPVASGAETWIGFTTERGACPGNGSSLYHDDFTLDMVPGSGTGFLTFAGYTAIPVVTNWNVDGKWAYFAASSADPNNGTLMLTGWIRGRRMRGWVTGHDYTTGCVVLGKLKGWL